ncbi:MAG: YrzE family protein [Mycobacterium sp.]|nr:YrzE family protein [Mycobacterium sp.]
MTNWMLRGLVFAAAMVIVRLFQGALINVWQTQAGLISIVLLALFIAGVVAWGVIDGRADATANPDPDRREDLAMMWLLAGLIAGVLSGAVAWLVSLFYKSLYVGGLINELTTFAAFTALLVFVSGIGGAALGRWLVDRNPPAIRPRGNGDEDRVDTDVFAAVRVDETAAEDVGRLQGQHWTAEATQPEEHGAATPPAYEESTTEGAATEHTVEWTEPAAKTDEDQR